MLHYIITRLVPTTGKKHNTGIMGKIIQVIFTMLLLYTHCTLTQLLGYFVQLLYRYYKAPLKLAL